ncbi:MAG: transglycosylase domain-containing protein, partial [Ktedonobacterales bacterium]
SGPGGSSFVRPPLSNGDGADTPPRRATSRSDATPPRSSRGEPSNPGRSGATPSRRSSGGDDRDEYDDRPRSQGAPPPRGRSRAGADYDDGSDDGYGAPPPRGGSGRDGRDSSRRSMAQMARDLSQNMSRQLSSVVGSARRAVDRFDRTERGASPRSMPSGASGRGVAMSGASGAGGASSAAFSAETLELTAQRYRRSRIRMRSRKWRLGRVRPNPIGYAILFAVTVSVVVSVLGMGGLGTAYAVNYYSAHAADIQAVANQRFAQSAVIYDRNGIPLYTVPRTTGINYYVPLSQISQTLQTATIDTEDHTFYSPTNIGIDFYGTLRAALANVHAGGASQGGSTITQQLVKNLVLHDPSKAYQRKINEAILAYGVTRQYTKQQILEMYLNTIDYGDQNEGIEAAARNYFGLKPKTDAQGNVTETASQQLDLAQAAMLAGIPNAPTLYQPDVYTPGCTAALATAGKCTDAMWVNPCTGDPHVETCYFNNPNPDFDFTSQGHEWLVYERAEVVLNAMVRYGDTTRAQADAALQEVHDILLKHEVQHWAVLGGSDAFGTTKIAPGFVDYVTGVLADQFGIDLTDPATPGYKIWTTLDYHLEQAAEDAATYYIDKPHNLAWPEYCNPCDGLPPLSTDKNVHNASVVAIDPHTGDIMAMVGSVNYTDTSKQVAGFNNIATSHFRSMGSSTKPLVYATAFQMGWNPGVMMQDAPVCFPVPTGDNKPDPDAPACKGYYTPHNFEPESFAGRIPIRYELGSSMNIPATEAMSFVGDNSATANGFLAMAQRMGVTTLKSGAMGPTTALGTQAIPLLQLTSAYGTFADQGKHAPYRSILRIEAPDGHLIWQAPSNPAAGQVMSPQTAYMMTSILDNNAARAPAFNFDNPLTLDDPNLAADNYNFPDLAAKTGTSQGIIGPRDIVTMGYTPYLALGVWAGNTDSSDLAQNIIGIAGAGYIFHDVMAWAIKNYNWPRGEQFPMPSTGLAIGQFNCDTGLAPYKGDKIAPCEEAPYRGPQDIHWGKYNGNTTNMYAGYLTTSHIDQDWYIQGQEWLQS